MKVLVTYSNEKYESARNFLVNSAKNISYFDKVFDFGPDDIDPIYIKEHENIFNIERGNGLWLWKPYFINRVFKNLEEGDLLFYCDAGAFFINSPKAIEDSFEDIFVTDIPLIEKQFTKKSVLEKLNVLKEDTESNQIIATYFVVRKTKLSNKIIEEWKLLCEDINLLSPNDEIPEDACFISHREDQSLLSLICKKYRVRVFGDISHRRILNYTYWNKRYIFRIKKYSENKNIILLLHKLPSVSNYKIMKLLLKQLIHHTTNYTRHKLRSYYGDEYSEVHKYTRI